MISFLLGFWFKILNLLDQQIAHLDSFLFVTVIVTCFEQTLYVSFLQFKQYVCMFYIVGNIFLMTDFKHFDFVEWFSSSSNSLLERLSINNCLLVNSSVNFLFDFLMCLCISFMAFVSLKFSSSELILVNLQPNSFPIAFRLLIS